MRWMDVNEIAERTNDRLESAGKLFRLKVVNLVETGCIRCDRIFLMEQNSHLPPICEDCDEAGSSEIEII